MRPQKKNKKQKTPEDCFFSHNNKMVSTNLNSETLKIDRETTLKSVYDGEEFLACRVAEGERQTA